MTITKKAQFKRDLNEMLKDEKRAKGVDYSKLIKTAPNLEIKRKLMGIRMQEGRHYQILSDIKKRRLR